MNESEERTKSCHLGRGQLGEQQCQMTSRHGVSAGHEPPALGAFKRAIGLSTLIRGERRTSSSNPPSGEVRREMSPSNGMPPWILRPNLARLAPKPLQAERDDVVRVRCRKTKGRNREGRT